MMRLFSPRKTRLLFVIRDKTKVCIFKASIFFWKNIFFVLTTLIVSNSFSFSFGFSPVDSIGTFRTSIKGRYSKGKHNILFYTKCILYSFCYCSMTAIVTTQIWDAIPKPQAHKDIVLSEFFNVSGLIYQSKSRHFYSECYYLILRWRLLLWPAMKIKKSYLRNR